MEYWSRSSRRVRSRGAKFLAGNTTLRQYVEPADTVRVSSDEAIQPRVARFAAFGSSVISPVLRPLRFSIRKFEAISRSHGWSLEGLNLFEIMPAPESLLPEDQYTVFHPSDVELGTTFKRIFDQVDAVKPKRVVLDSLSEIRLLIRDLSRYRRQILG
jgi:hypothetical protein